MAFFSSTLPVTREDHRGSGPMLRTGDFKPRTKVSYTVQTVTGSMPGCGTSAQVFITLHGTQGDSKRVALNNNGEKNFQRGATDTFTIRELDLGVIESVTVSHDSNSTFSERFDPAWYLEHIVVRGRSCEWTFPCRRWLAKSKEDGKTKRTLYSRQADASISYKVTVYTGEAPDAGTIGRVSVKLHGKKGATDGFIPLKNTSVHDTFERSMKDMFLVNARDVGPLESITVRHCAPPGEGGWALSGLVVRNQKSNQECVFVCGEVLGENDSRTLKHTPGAQIPVRPSPAVRAAETREHRGALRAPYKQLNIEDHDPYKGKFREMPSQYEITVCTGAQKDAGTDSEVFLRLFGTKRSSGSIRLAAHTAVTSRLYARGSVDRFVIAVPDVGTPTRVCVWVDGRSRSDLGASWRCEKVMVKRVAEGRYEPTYTFPCGAWFDNGPGNTLKRDLIPQAAGGGVRPSSAHPSLGHALRPDSARPPSAAGGAGTIAYAGDRGGALDIVRPITSGLPKPTIMYDDTDGGEPLHLPFAPQVRRAYKVWVHTGDRPHAGTDCEVMMRIHGDAKASNTFRLSACALKAVTLFRRGGIDEFLIQDWDVGDVRKITIWHDAKGSDPNWFLEKVVVQPVTDTRVGSMATDKIRFECGRWLSPKEGDKKTRVELVANGTKSSVQPMRTSQRLPTRPYMNAL